MNNLSDSDLRFKNEDFSLQVLNFADPKKQENEARIQAQHMFSTNAILKNLIVPNSAETIIKSEFDRAAKSD